ncbi:MAG: hypothetical protein R6X31_08055 [Anaerolineae bacterium]
MFQKLPRLHVSDIPVVNRFSFSGVFSTEDVDELHSPAIRLPPLAHHAGNLQGLLQPIAHSLDPVAMTTPVRPGGAFHCTIGPSTHRQL